jgi:hypothetical protein
MKIRNGFVSNSSSSSFVAYGAEVTIADIEAAADIAYLKQVCRNHIGDEFDDEYADDKCSSILVDELYSYGSCK